MNDFVTKQEMIEYSKNLRAEIRKLEEREEKLKREKIREKRLKKLERIIKWKNI